MILYRPVGLEELALIYDSGMKAFPARLPQQPIFYPVLDLEYARQTASGWNAKNGQLAGYVTQFKVEDDYIDQFEEHTVGGSQHQELWIPTEEIEEFNRHITGHIKVVEAHFGNAFQGFVPDKSALQGKTAAEQFTVLTDSYLYKRMDFYLEIKRNHKAVFLNYPFWQKHEFKNPGLKEKVLQAIKEAWFSSFPQVPLPLPPPISEETPIAKRTASPARRFAAPVHSEIPPGEQPDSIPEAKPVPGKVTPVPRADPRPPAHLVPEEILPIERTDPDVEDDVESLVEENTSDEQGDVQFVERPVQEETPLPEPTDSHFAEGIRLGISEKYPEAIAELFKAVEEDPDDAVAQTSLGVAFHRLGEEDRALACYEKALQIDPIYAEAHYFRANVLYNHGNVREAMAGYTVAIGLQPELIEAHLKPRPQDRLTDYTGAPAEIARIAKPAHRILERNEILESNPRQTSLLKERAADYYRLRNYAQAIADYSSSLAIHPQDANVLHLRGNAYEQLGQSERAREDYQQALALNPQMSNDYINRGITFANTGNHRQAIASLTDGIRLAPQNPDAYFNRGIVYFQQNDFARAVDDFSDVIRLSPRDEGAYYWRGMSYEAAGRRREAVADYRQLLSLSQDLRAKAEIEQKLNQIDLDERESNLKAAREDTQEPRQAQAEKPERDSDLHGLIIVLGERARKSIWFGSGVNCVGEKAEQLYALTDQGKLIEGRDFLSLAAGIHQTIEGDFQAFDPGATSPWIFIRAWEGTGFYVETNDPRIRQRLKSQFSAVEDVEGATPPYEGIFIRM
jgi:tetratricopeptide (TPR) repeat protein